MAEAKLLILPASRVNPNTILIFKRGGFTEVHCSDVLLPLVQTTAPIPMNTPKFLNNGQEMASNIEMITSMLQLIND